MKHPAPSPSALRVSELSQNSPTAFAIRPETARLQQIAERLEILGLRKLSFQGDIKASGSADWILTGTLGATVIQPCAVTLEPVTTRIDVPVRRLFLRDFVETDAPEVEMPEDDEVEPLSAWIDPDAIMLEALDLSLPLYPRSDGAEIGAVTVTEPGKTPMRDEDARPFAGLAALKDKLSSKSDGDS